LHRVELCRNAGRRLPNLEEPRDSTGRNDDPNGISLRI
jgi:hypothetical protein